MEHLDLLVQALVTIVTTLFGYGAVSVVVDKLRKEVAGLRADIAKDRQTVITLQQEVRNLQEHRHA